MLRFAEEVLLLLVDEENGVVAFNYPPFLLDCVFASAVLMDLALEGRIDTDLEHLILVDPAPVGDSLLDPTLADIARGPVGRDADFWIERTAARGTEIRAESIARLVKAGILESGSDELVFLSRLVSRTRRYPPSDKKTQEDVRLRIMRALFTEDIPDPRDTMTICLADACGIIERLLSVTEREEVAERLELILKMDLIGQSLVRAIKRLKRPVAPPAASKEIPRASPWGFVAAVTGLGGGDLGAFLLKQYRNLGPVFSVRVLNRRYIILAGPDANEFFAGNNACFRTRESWRSFYSDTGALHSVISMDGPEHIRRRRAITRGYTRQIIENRVDAVIRIIQRELRHWPQHKPVPGHYFCQRLIIEQLGLLTTGVSALDHIDDVRVFFNTMLDRHIVRRFPMMSMYLPRFRRARHRVEEFGREIIAQHQPDRRRGQPPDFVDDLLDLHRNDPQFMPETDLVMGVLGPFLVAMDTASNVCAFMLYELLKQPELLARVTAEADDLFARGISDVRDLRQLDVTHRVAMETMRCHPIIPMVHRTVANSFEFDGYRVPAGAELLFAFVVAHDMPEYYPEPQRFDIDRYLEGRAEHRQRKGIYAPFGAGAHKCLGSSLAEALIVLNLATILHETAPTLHPPGYTLKVRHFPTVHPNAAFRFKMARRAAPED